MGRRGRRRWLERPHVRPGLESRDDDRFWIFNRRGAECGCRRWLACPALAFAGRSTVDTRRIIDLANHDATPSGIENSQWVTPSSCWFQPDAMIPRPHETEDDADFSCPASRTAQTWQDPRKEKGAPAWSAHFNGDPPFPINNFPSLPAPADRTRRHRRRRDAGRRSPRRPGCTRHSPQARKPSRSGHREFSCHTRRVQGGRSVLPFLETRL